MGGTTLVTRGYLSPIEGDVVQRDTELPLDVEYVVHDLYVEMEDELEAIAYLPEELFADVEMLDELEVIVQVPDLEVETRLED